MAGSRLYRRQKKVDAVCDEVKEIELVKPVTPVTLSRNPGNFFASIDVCTKKKYKKMNTDGEPPEELPRLLSLTPTISFKWRFVAININALSAIAEQTMVNSYQNQVQSFLNVFGLSGFSIRR
jgi:hypothetical protein